MIVVDAVFLVLMIDPAATAIVRGASDLYTDDPNLGKYLKGTSVTLRLIDDLPSPPEEPQRKLDL
ncbi:hypothetical protein [Rhizobium mulingense]|uniref:hypothetical protein n=1 Tax=Rhizobium mulingense TaxID=3031128 RepID=UPI002B490745|nr:hypothetical protein [Rhizobium sp. MJ21]MEB3045874.1 hypothetical protein [Rhizobium sp. MJ21]